MVTFDKGGRVARLEEGAVFDARQTGILLAGLVAPDVPGRHGRLLEWDRDRSPVATARIDQLVATKGAAHKQTLLIALSMSVLTRFEIDDPDTGRRYHLEGDRSQGYRVSAAGGP